MASRRASISVSTRDDEERQERGEHESEDDGGAECLPHGVGESDRNDTEYGAERGDAYGFESRFSGVDDSFLERYADAEIDIDLVDQDDRVLHDDAEERENADQSGEGERYAEECEADEDSDERERECDKHKERFPERVELDDERRDDEERRDDHRLQYRLH